MVREVEQSRRILRRLFNVPVNYFCYPAGRYNASVIATVRSAGYIAATTTNYGVARPSQGRFTLDRIRVDGTDTATTLGQKLTALHLLG
jgi:peptidoglycan/xylan/chitin deacetylase (PgdA/CDA1 family)